MAPPPRRCFRLACDYNRIRIPRTRIASCSWRGRRSHSSGSRSSAPYYIPTRSANPLDYVATSLGRPGRDNKSRNCVNITATIIESASTGSWSRREDHPAVTVGDIGDVEGVFSSRFILRSIERHRVSTIGDSLVGIAHRSFTVSSFKFSLQFCQKKSQGSIRCRNDKKSIAHEKINTMPSFFSMSFIFFFKLLKMRIKALILIIILFIHLIYV